MLKEDDALAAETAGEEDEDAAGLETWARTGGTNRFADLMGMMLANDSTVSWGLLCND